MDDSQRTFTASIIDGVAAAVARILSEGTVQPEWLTPKQASIYCGLSPFTLEMWRRNGGGPAFSRKDGKSVRYRRADIDAFLLSHMVQR